jgi:hypothetical protein
MLDPISYVVFRDNDQRIMSFDMVLSWKNQQKEFDKSTALATYDWRAIIPKTPVEFLKSALNSPSKRINSEKRL